MEEDNINEVNEGGKVFIQSSTLTNIANAIRTKSETAELYYPQDMPQAILDIETDPTGDADATANDIINPKTAYVQGVKLTGNIEQGYGQSIITLPYVYTQGTRTVTIDNFPEDAKNFIIQDWDHNGWYIMICCYANNFGYWKYTKNDKWYAYTTDGVKITNNSSFKKYKSNRQDIVSWVEIGTGYDNDSNWYTWFGGSDTVCYNDDGSIFYMYQNVPVVSLTRNAIKYVNTADATATADDILDTKTAYVQGQKLIGTIQTGSLANMVDDSKIQIRSNYLGMDPQIPGTQFYMGNLNSNNPKWIYSSVGLTVTNSNLANYIGLSSNILKSGETILGVTGTYNPYQIRQYVSETAMNNDINNISEGEVVKVVDSGVTTFYLKETTMKKLVKEEDTISPADYSQAEEQIGDLFGEEESE